MTTFLVRVELRNENNYLEFHEAMERRGFRRTLYEDGKVKDLPTGTYVTDEHPGIHTAVLEALHAVHEVGTAGKIVASGAGEIATSGLDEHSALLGALARRLGEQASGHVHHNQDVATLHGLGRKILDAQKARSEPSAVLGALARAAANKPRR